MRKIYFLLLVITVIAGSCRKNFDINQYANQPADILPSFLLQTGLSQTAFNNANNYLVLNRWMGYWARSKDAQPDEQAETYDIKNSYTDDEWTRIYQNLGTYDLLEKISKEQELPFYIGAAKVMKAYCFSTLVDLYNDVPYKQAFDPATKSRPVYDDAREIYNDLVAQLDSAFTYFENARLYYKDQSINVAITDDQYDIMFGGKGAGYNDRLTLWERFTNTLELKLLMHQSEIGSQQSFITTEINSIATSNVRKAAGFIGANESATVNPGYDGSIGKENPFYNLFFTAEGNAKMKYYYYTANTYASDFYENGNDVRWNFFYYSDEDIVLNPFFGTPGDTSWIYGGNLGNDTVFIYYLTDDSVIAVLNGDTLHPRDFGGNYDGAPTRAPFFSSTLNSGYGIFKEVKQDQLIFSDFESLFLQAEAKLRWPFFNADQNAQPLYESAIIQNFIYLYYPYPAANILPDVQQYIAQDIKDIGWAASQNNKLEAILTQKWAALNGINWVEAYNDYRRTGYPNSNILGISHAPTHVRPQIPTRFLYPQSQLNTNGANVPPLPDAQYSKVFWDQ